MQEAEKVKELNKWILQAFEDTVVEDILNNARKSGEALCKSASASQLYYTIMEKLKEPR